MILYYLFGFKLMFSLFKMIKNKPLVNLMNGVFVIRKEHPKVNLLILCITFGE